MSMWELLIKNEVVDRVDLKTSEYNEAHSYFRLIKILSNKSFNEIFKVRKCVKLKQPLGEVKWWKDESATLDEF